MKKITLWLIALLFCWQLEAQVSAYTFSQSTGAYTEITGGTVLGTATNDDDSFNANPIGFTFTYNGNNYTQFSVNSNGFIAMGTTISSSSTAISSGSTNNVIAALNGDLQSTATTGELSYLLSGSTPNQVLTIQWKNYKHYGTAGNGDNNNFQIKLFESSNLIQFVYGSFTQNSTSRTRQIGLRGASSASYVNRTTTTDWSATTSGTANNASCTLTTAVVPSSGLTFTWTPPSCLSPNGFNATSVLATTATINWTAQTPAPSVGYEYYYDTVNTTPTVSGTPTTVATANLSGLMANTLYYVWLRSDCGSGQSSWSTPFTFRTTCNINAAPWLYDVESATLTTNSNIVDCWSSTPNNTTSAFRWNVDGDGGTPSNATTGPNSAFSGVKYFYTEASSGSTGAVAELLSPLVDITSLTSPSLQFYYHMYGVSIGELHIDIYNGTTWTNDVDVIIGQQQTVQGNPWVNRVINLAAFSGTIQVRFRAIRGTSTAGDISLDDINIIEGPSCYPPTNLTVYNITDTTADLNWTENATAFDWEYVVQAPGSGIPTTSGVSIDAQPYEVASGYGITGLAPSTNYEVYLRSSCNVLDKSAWFGPVNFKTECAIFTVPSLEDFTVYVPNCWEEAFGGDLVNGPSSFDDNDWYSDGFGNVGTTGSASFEIWLASANDWLITPTYTIPATGYELKFNVAATQWNTTSAPTTPWESDDYVEVLISTTGTNNWTVLYTYNNTNVPPPTGSNNIFNLDAYAGQNVKFAFRVVEGASDGSADLNFYVDNFEIRLTPTSPPLCATNVVATPNASCGNFATAITWDSVSSADGYRINIGTSAGATDVLSNFDVGTALTYSHIGSVNTSYFVTILPYNSIGNAIGCSETTFMTNVDGCYCTSLPTSNDNSGITNVLLASTNFPTTDVTYFDHTATPVDLAQGVNSNVQITFATGYSYNTYVYIDFNNDFDFADPGELVFTGESASSNPTTYNASFVIPSTAPLGNHNMRIVTADDLVTSNPCYSGSYGVTLDFAINIVAPSCTPPAFSSDNVVHDCVNSLFNVNVNITALGNGTPAITDGVSVWPVTAVGNIQVGPFAYGTPVTLTLNHGSDNVCNVIIGTYNYASCPPTNDNCVNAQVLNPGSNYLSNITDGNNTGATSGSEPSPTTCFGYSGGDVWYSVVVPASGSITIETGNSSTGATGLDTVFTVYSGTCGSLTQIGCDDDGAATAAYSLLALSGRTPGETLLVRVYEYSNDNTGAFGISAYDASLSTSTFDSTSFKAYPNPVKDILTLEYATSISSVRIMNLLGQEVISRTINANETKIDMSQLNSGAYIVNVIIDDAVRSIKVIKE